MNALTSKLRVCRERTQNFLSPAESDRWLICLRVGLGLAIVFYSLSLRYDWNYLFGGSDEALVRRALTEKILSLDSRLVPRVGWLVLVGGRLGLDENTVLSIAWACLLCAGSGLLAGILSRLSAVVAWFIHLSAAKTGE